MVRTVWRGKIWAAGPLKVIRDNSDLLAIYIVPGAKWKCPVALSGERVKPRLRASGEYKVVDAVWERFTELRLKIPGTDYSVELFYDERMAFAAWYINMETPFKRVPAGFEYTDEELDIILQPDLSSWHWKDEDELEEAVACGLMTRERAAYLYKEGERAAKWLQTGDSPFNKWADWKPDPSLVIPVLSEGWDRL